MLALLQRHEASVRQHFRDRTGVSTLAELGEARGEERHDSLVIPLRVGGIGKVAERLAAAIQVPALAMQGQALLEQ
jgi:hypothetical protein